MIHPHVWCGSGGHEKAAFEFAGCSQKLGERATWAREMAFWGERSVPIREHPMGCSFEQTKCLRRGKQVPSMSTSWPQLPRSSEPWCETWKGETWCDPSERAEDVINDSSAARLRQKRKMLRAEHAVFSVRKLSATRCCRCPLVQSHFSLARNLLSRHRCSSSCQTSSPVSPNVSLAQVDGGSMIITIPQDRGCATPGASARSWPSVYIPPLAGGEAPFEATMPRMTSAPVGLLPADPVAEGGDRDRHFHQLFRLLRLTENRTRKAGWPGDLGHCDNLLGHHGVDELDHGHQLVHQLRLRYSKRGHHGSYVGKLLHGVSLHPLLRPRRLCQAEEHLLVREEESSGP